jgi:hypothetical protein
VTCQHITPDHQKFQTRSEETGLAYFDTLEAAKKASEADPSIWKMSFTIQTGERIVLEKDYTTNEWFVRATGILDRQTH